MTMSKRLQRRKSKGVSRAAVNVQLAVLSDYISTKSGSCSSPELSVISSCTSRILSLTSEESSERKALMHKSSSGLYIMMKTLKISDDPSAVMNIVSTLNILASRKYASLIVREGAVPGIMVSLLDTYRSQWGTHSILTSHLSLLNKLSTKDKKFAVKARLSGILPTVVKLLRTTQNDQEILIKVLSLLKPMAGNTTNAESLGTLGCVGSLIKLVTKTGHRDLIITSYCLEVLVVLLKTKSNVSRSVLHDPVKQLLLLHKQLHYIDRSSRYIALRKKILQCLKFCITADGNLQAFHKNNGLQLLYATAQQNAEAPGLLLCCLPFYSGELPMEVKLVKTDTRAIESMTCMVLRKGLPPVSLPLASLKNPTSFQLSDHKSSISSSSSSKTTSSDPSQVPPPKKASWEEQLEEVEEAGGVSISAASTSLVPLPVGVRRTQGSSSSRSRDLPTTDSDSEDVNILTSNTTVSNDCSDAGDLRAPVHILKTDCSSTTPDSNGRNLIGASAANEEIKSPNIKGLDQFKNLFPELKEMHCWYPSQCLETCSDSSDQNQWPELKEVSSCESCNLQQQVVVVPTAADCSGSSGEDISDVKDLLVETSSKDGFPKSAIQFVEEPLPQLLGHSTACTSSELVFIKRGSTDRKLYLSDIARITTPQNVINKTVFDLDSLLMPDSENNPEVVSEPVKPVSISSDLDTILRELSLIDMDTENLCDLPYVETGSSASDAPTDEGGSRVADTSSPTAYKGVSGKNLCDESSSGNAIEDGDGLDSDQHLIFESRFECGNLRKSIQVRQHEYDLILNADINTRNHHQWFYFKVTNNVAKVPYRFNIINLEKPNSQFNSGMQPVMYSVSAAHANGQGWVRAGTKISYYKNNFTIFDDSKGADKKKKKVYHTLTFTVVFQHSKDTCYFAYHYPYSYSMLLNDLDIIERSIKSKELYYHRQPLCTTLCGNICPLITISSELRDPSHSQQDFDAESNGKKYVVLSARIHPGESNSSWIMRGILYHLINDTPEAKSLRDKFIFKIIPMLNPDGVIHGSHRCSLYGDDLNRQWITPGPSCHPTIHHAKSLLQWLVATNRRPEVFCDLHGHSRKKNIFMYGCKGSSSSSTEQILPRVMNRIAPFFNYSDCSFAVEKSKEATARVVVWKELGVTMSYTMESTYCGADRGQNKGRQINTKDLEEQGAFLCNALLELDNQSPDLSGGRSDQKENLTPTSSHSDSSCFKYSSGDDTASSGSAEN